MRPRRQPRKVATAWRLDAVTMEKIVALCKRRGFIFQSSEIYGGLASTYDYGHYGVLLKNNVKDEWWRAVVQERDDMVALDAAILMHPRTWEASGHVAELHRPARPVRGQVQEALAGGPPAESPGEDGELRCPECGGELGEAREFNLMFETFMGPVREDAARIFLRPETAQGIFVNFKNVLQFARKKPPFGIAQIGKAFRNEITPGNFIFRTREFEQMEIEFFVPPAEAEEWHQRWMDDRMRWYTDLGIRPDHLQLREHGADELSHYSAGDERRRVPVPDGLVGARGHREPHRLRPQAARRVLGREARRTSTRRPASATSRT